MTDRRITGAEARALREAATPGPWHVAPPGDPGMGEVQTEDGHYVAAPGDADANLMAAAPLLCLTVEALEAERDAALAEVLRQAAWDASETAFATAELRRERDAALTQVAALSDVLTGIEWSDSGGCPGCGHGLEDDGHAPECPVGRVLRDTEAVAREHDREVRGRALEEAADAMHAEADSRPLGDAAPDGPLAGASTYNILRHGERFLRARAAAERGGEE